MPKKRAEIEDLFKNAPKRYARKPRKADGANMDTMLARAGVNDKT